MKNKKVVVVISSILCLISFVAIWYWNSMFVAPYAVLIPYGLYWGYKKINVGNKEMRRTFLSITSMIILAVVIYCSQIIYLLEFKTLPEIFDSSNTIGPYLEYESLFWYFAICCIFLEIGIRDIDRKVKSQNNNEIFSSLIKAIIIFIIVCIVIFAFFTLAFFLR